MRKKTLIPFVPVKSDKKSKEQRKIEREKQIEAKGVYLGIIADKVLDAIEKIFDESTPKPNGVDMLDVMSLVPVLIFSRQIGMQCKNKKAMQSVLKSVVWSLHNNIDMYSEPFITKEEAWGDLMNIYGDESDGSDKS